MFQVKAYNQYLKLLLNNETPVKLVKRVHQFLQYSKLKTIFAITNTVTMSILYGAKHQPHKMVKRTQAIHWQ